MPPLVRKTGGRSVSFGDIVVGLIVAIFVIQVIALLVGIWVPEFRAIRLGQGVLLMAVLVSVFFAVAIIRRKWSGGTVTRGDILMFLLLVVLTIMALYFLPRMIPDIFAREEFIGTLNRAFQVT